MAIGGSLRAAMKAGNWAKAAMESRRRARALADLNARGGIRGGEGMRFARAGEGTSERTLDSLIDRGFQPDMYAWNATGPRGNQVFLDPNTGARELIGRNFSQRMGQRGYGIAGSNPIEAPFEGFRVLRYDPNYLMGGPVTPDFPPIPRAFYPPSTTPLPMFLRKPTRPRRLNPTVFFDDLA